MWKRLHELRRRLARRYRPELHYMRGLGPACTGKKPVSETDGRPHVQYNDQENVRASANEPTAETYQRHSPP
jgi:hypothetical protein